MDSGFVVIITLNYIMKSIEALRPVAVRELPLCLIFDLL